MPERIVVERSPARLVEGGRLQRLPRNQWRRRPRSFYDAFESYQLFYDVFWHQDGQRILAVGPTPRNLRGPLERAKARALPDGQPLEVVLHASLSTMLVEFRGAPQGARELSLDIDGQTFTLTVQPNLSSVLEGARVLFTMNKNNDLAWIAEWANWYVHFHGTDTIFVFDNGSERYGSEEVAATLANIQGLKRFAVISFPHRYGPIDPGVIFDPFWARFAQISNMSLVLRRFAASAAGVLNCDIDELAHAPGGESLYDVVRRTPKGLLILPGRWVEANREDETGDVTHSNFCLVSRDKKLRDSSPVKWILDPTRSWVQNLGVHPYMHWVHGRPAFGKSFVDGAFYWHFRGANTGWRVHDRAQPRAELDMLEPDAELASAMANFKARH